MKRTTSIQSRSAIFINELKDIFIQNGGIMKTCQLNNKGLSSRQIKKLLEENTIQRIKHGYYILAETFPREEVVISRLFLEAVIFLESALVYYHYTDRIPYSWQIAVEKHANPDKYNFDYLTVTPYFIKKKYLDLGIKEITIDNVKVKIYNRDKTICDVLRYENKIDHEVFVNSIKRYIADDRKNIRFLMEYAKILNVVKKVQAYIGVWI
ncbi:MAG: type IV toxin-antitoxin system AbiEi family antitoxin domain-containing protein [Bacteroidota bacterium]